MSIKKDILWRVGVIYMLAAILGLLIIGRIIQLQFFQYDKWTSKVHELTFKNIIIKPNRGDIYADNGHYLLASSVPHYELRMDTRSTALEEEVFNEKVDSLAYCLAALFKNKSKNEYKQDLIRAHNKKNRYFLVKRDVTYYQLKKVKKFPIFRKGQFAGGLIIVQRNKRVNPFGELAKRTIGYLTQSREGSMRGHVGLENAYEKELKGIEGLRVMQKISGGDWIPVNDNNEIEPKDGYDIVSTINIKYQDVAHNALLRQLRKYEAHHGCVVLMEVKTGEVKAVVNLEKRKDGTYKESFNYAIWESVEPGSTFKLMSLLAALEDGKVKLTDSVDTKNGKKEYYDRTMRDAHTGGYGKISVQQAFEKSSNVGISTVIVNSYNTDRERFYNRLYRFHLHEKLNIEILGESSPYIKEPSKWSGITLPWMSIGYEVRLTPLQILAFYNAIANDGVMLKPLFIKEIKYHGKTVKTFDKEILNASVCSKRTLKQAHIILEGAVERGTAKNLINPNYKIAGKTGTAQIARRNTGYGETSQKIYRASFAGYFPAENPIYSCIVVIDSLTGKEYYANLVAGPVFKEIADKVYASGFEMHEPVKQKDKIAEIPKTKNGYKKDLETICKALNIPVSIKGSHAAWAVTEKGMSKLILYDRIFEPGKVPDVKGMGLKDALFLLENSGLQVKMHGKGKVVSQSIEPGTEISGNPKIWLELAL